MVWERIVQPGDTVQVHGGTYKANLNHYTDKTGLVPDGTYWLTAKGTKEKPIVVKDQNPWWPLKKYPPKEASTDYDSLTAFQKASGHDTHRWLAGKVRKSYPVTVHPPVEFADELYALIKTPGQEQQPRVLLEIDKSKAQQVYPETSDDFTYAMTWIKDYGKGRVFYSALGHEAEEFTKYPEVLAMTVRGLLWAAGA